MFKLRFRQESFSLWNPPAEPSQEGDVQKMYTTCFSEKTKIKHWPALGQHSQFAPRLLLRQFGYKIQKCRKMEYSDIFNKKKRKVIFTDTVQKHDKLLLPFALILCGEI